MTALYLCWNQRNRRFVGDEITPKCISDFSGKAWLLPAININKDGTLKPESKWKLGKP